MCVCVCVCVCVAACVSDCHRTFSNTSTVLLSIPSSTPFFLPPPTPPPPPPPVLQSGGYVLHTLQGKGGLNKRQVACTLDWQSITCKKPGGSSKSNLMMNLRTVRNISRDPGNNSKVRLSVCLCVLCVSVCVCDSCNSCNSCVSVFLPLYSCFSASLSLFVPLRGLPSSINTNI